MTQAAVAEGPAGRNRRVARDCCGWKGLPCLQARLRSTQPRISSWLLFAALLLVPDVSFAAYLAGPRVGALCYNLVHTTIGPIALWVVGSIVASPVSFAVALIWLAHIGIDRALGYGLKYDAGFGFTHLGRIGPAARTQKPSG